MAEKPSIITKEILEQMEALMEARRQFASTVEQDIELKIEAQSKADNTIIIEVDSCGIHSTKKIKTTENL